MCGHPVDPDKEVGRGIIILHGFGLDFHGQSIATYIAASGITVVCSG
jgi:dienelactone hydrolase